MDTMKLFIAIPNRINFLQFGRYGSFSEQTYRNLFKNEKFDWFAFNSSIINERLTGKRKAIAIDPSYIPKSGHKTPWIVMLNELDKELTQRGHPFVCYADDSMIFCKSEKAAIQTKESITRFIERKLHLKVNKPNFRKVIQNSCHKWFLANFSFLYRIHLCNACFYQVSWYSFPIPHEAT